MAWEKANAQGGSFVKFEEGKSVEGVYQGSRERQNPFGDGTIMDHLLEVNGEKVTLSSTSENLRITLPALPVGTKVKIEMLTRKGRKLYDVYVDK